MRVLMVGLGSIGRRNLESAKRVRPCYTFAALRREDSPPISEPPDLTSFTRAEEALGFQPDLVWVCNPTSMHAETVSQLAKAHTAFFIEKPLAHTSADLQKMVSLLESRPFFYGCILRHHPVIKRVREILASNHLGQPLSYEAFCGSYLPDWRSGQDYRDSYSAKGDMGGGAALDLIHEFDYAEHWFGPIAIARGVRVKRSSLEIHADDLCAATVTHESGVPGQIHVDYYRPVPRRTFEIIFSEGVLEGNLLTGSLMSTIRGPTGTAKTEVQLPISRDDLHDRQSESIFSALERNERSTWSVHEAAGLVEKVLAIR